MDTQAHTADIAVQKNATARSITVLQSTLSHRPYSECHKSGQHLTYIYVQPHGSALQVCNPYCKGFVNPTFKEFTEAFNLTAIGLTIESH